MPPRVLLLDNYDSFTWNLAHLLGACGATVDVVRNDVSDPDRLLARGWSHVVVSPGPGTPERAGTTIALIRAAVERVPLLGVCLGHQALAVALGGNVVRAKVPVHGETCRLVHSGAGLFRGIPEDINVARYHSLVVEEASLPADLVVDARSADPAGVVMAIRHARQPAFGVQFHPESFLSEWGRELVSRFLSSDRTA
jgi:anthranilate synthase component II